MIALSLQGVVPAGPHGRARDWIKGFHRDVAPRLPGPAIPGQEPVRLLQPVRGCRAEFAGRAHPGRGPPDPGEQQSPLHAEGETFHKPQVEGCLTGASPGVPARRASGGTTREIGTVHDIDRRRAARAWTYNSRELDAQFRTSGGSAGLRGLGPRLLGLSDGGCPGQGDENYRLLLAGHPRTVEAFLEAGFILRATPRAWPRLLLAAWSDAVRENFAARCADRAVGATVEQQRGTQARGRPGRSLWATDDGGFGQIGCAHTAGGPSTSGRV